jgi:hypothetical protein
VASKPHGPALQVEAAIQSRAFCPKSFSAMKICCFRLRFDFTQRIQEKEIETK